MTYYYRGVGAAAVAGAIFALAPSALAQRAINVTVDGDIVPFAGQPPIERFGSVLVPLRGVFEKLGATVAYDGGSRTILAVRGATSVSLKIGSQDAQVNGQPRRLALPAQEIRGTTLVPLRFVSEALGANVRWNGDSRTVIIATTNNGNNGAGGETPSDNGNAGDSGNSGGLAVESLTTDAKGTLRAGETINITLVGTPGGKATASLSGVPGANAIALSETGNGRYSGTFTVPKGANTGGATLLGMVSKNGRTSPLLQSSTQIAMDTAGPTIARLSPAPDTVLAPGKPLIYGTISDAGTGVASNGLRLAVNGQDVTGAATVTEAFFSYRPEKNLPQGVNTVTVTARDAAGNETKKAWKFTISADAALIQEVTVEPNGASLGPGDVLTVRAKAKPGGNAHFDIGGVIKNHPMNEQSAGVYVGTYTIKKGDSLAKAPVTVTLSKGEQKASQTAENSLSIAAGAPNAPKITFPQPGASISTNGVPALRGTAAPGATVRYKISYRGTLLILPVAGTVAEGEVTANEKGQWSVPNLSLPTPPGVTKLTYSAEIVTIGAAGETSDPATVEFKK